MREREEQSDPVLVLFQFCGRFGVGTGDGLSALTRGVVERQALRLEIGVGRR